MYKLFTQERKVAFKILAPFVLFAAVILALWSIVGLVLFLVPGICGFMGLVGLMECWYGLIRPDYLRRHCDGVIKRAFAGLGIGVFASLVSAGDVWAKHFDDIIFVYLGAALIIYMPLSVVFLRGLAGVKDELDRAIALSPGEGEEASAPRMGGR